MSKNFVSEEAYKTIGQVAKELDLVDKKTGHFQTHTLRYWETQFKQIKPSVKAGGRRYFIKMKAQEKVGIRLQTRLIIYVMLLIKKQNLKLLGKMD